VNYPYLFTVFAVVLLFEVNRFFLRLLRRRLKNYSTMANSNYVIQLTVASQAGSRNDAPIITYGSQSTTSFRVYIGDSDNGESDLFRFDSEFMFTVITQ
jgi:hypothetical protein